MKFRSYGYVEKKIEVREMSMGAIIMTACQGLIKQGAPDMEIRIVDTYMGEVDKYNGVNEILLHDWPVDYKVNFLEAVVMHNNVEDYDYLKIVIRDEL